MSQCQSPPSSRVITAAVHTPFSPKNFDSVPAKWHLGVVLDAKLEHLRNLLKSYGSCLIAYSGGVDSVFLAHVAHLTLGEKSLAVIADSASLPRRELQEALDLGRQFGFPVRILKTNEFLSLIHISEPTRPISISYAVFCL